MTTSRVSLACVCLLCSQVAVAQRPDSQPNDHLPSLKLMFSSRDVSQSPVSLLAHVRIDGSGTIVMESSRSGATRLVVLDSTGAIVGRFAGSGSGPREVTAPQPVGFLDGNVVIWDLALLRLGYWTRLGESSGLVAVGQPVVPLSISDRGILGLKLTGGEATPVLINPQTGEIRPLLLRGHDFLAAPRSATPGGPPFVVSAGQWRDGFVLAHPASFRIGFFTWSGELVHTAQGPAGGAKLSRGRVELAIESYQMSRLFRSDPSEARLREARNQLESTRLPGFSPANPLGVDSQGRVWVMGIEGDSAFADVFSPPSYLGRIGVPCPGFEGRWSLAGRWLAVVCRPSEATFDGDAGVRVFKVESSKVLSRPEAVQAKGLSPR